MRSHERAVQRYENLLCQACKWSFSRHNIALALLALVRTMAEGANAQVSDSLAYLHQLTFHLFLPGWMEIGRASSWQLIAFGNSKIIYKVGNWHAWPPLPRGTAEKFPWDCFFPQWVWQPHYTSVYTLVKDLGVQTDNMLSPSAQCTEAAKRLDDWSSW